MSVVQAIGIVLLAIGLLLLYLEISGKKITESAYLGISGPVGFVLVAIGVVVVIIG